MNEISDLTEYFGDAVNFEHNLAPPELLGINELSNSNLCPICSNEAGKHIHYGGRGCSSCRAFFRRSVQSGNYNKFQVCLLDLKLS